MSAWDNAVGGKSGRSVEQACISELSLIGLGGASVVLGGRPPRSPPTAAAEGARPGVRLYPAPACQPQQS